MRQGNAAKAAGQYNAQVAEQRAVTVRQQTMQREEVHRERARHQIGMQLAATAESGTALAGSNLDLLSRSLYDAEMDALQIRYEGELNARGLINQAQLDRSMGREAGNAGYLSAASSVLNAASSYGGGGRSMPYSYNNDASGSRYSSTGANVRGRR